MDCLNSIDTNTESLYVLLLRAALLIPISHYILGIFFIIVVFLYNFLEIHILRDLFTGFGGQSVDLIFTPGSDVYQEVVSKCRILHGRYLSTPWLCSPHLQTAFLSLFGRPPTFNHRRQLFQTSDGGTIALDWLMNTDVKKLSIQVKDSTRDPIMIVIPGLTSDSDSAYVKHLAVKSANHGWNVVVSNHRGLGGVSITSDCFYNAGWTDDIRKVIDHIHNQYPEAPLFLVGTSIGANILVKYLGEDGANIPIFGAAAICSPWDLLICDRFINRKLVQRFYDKALTIGLKGYAQLHQTILSRLVDWEGIEKSHSVRDFDNYATRVLGKYETVDTYYRRCSSAAFVGNVMVPLLCISALDDPVCTSEAIPWDECRLNENVILATTQHGGHLAYFEGLTAKTIWWVRAINEFSSVLLTSSLIHKKKELQVPSLSTPQESSIDQAPYVNIQEDGTVAAIGEPITDVRGITNETMVENDEAKDAIPSADVNDRALMQEQTSETMVENDKAKDTIPSAEVNDQVMMQEQTNAPKDHTPHPERVIDNVIAPVKKCMDQLARRSTKSMWLLVYVAIVTTWPFVGSALLLFFKKRIRNFLPGKLPKL